MRKNKILAALLTAAVAATTVVAPLYAQDTQVQQASYPVIDGELLTETVSYPEGLEIRSIPVAEQQSITLTVDGVETNLEPGIYEGNVVLTITEQNLVPYESAGFIHEFRQAVYVDENGVSADKSVDAAVLSGEITDEKAQDVVIRSEGDLFNGIVVAGGSYTVSNADIQMKGDGGNDFVGFGSAIMASGENTTLVIEDTSIETEGVVRTTLTPSDGANVIVKNSSLSAADGVLPEDYIASTTLGYMKSVPWMLGLVGNNRATNMLGKETQETFINSEVLTQNWGVLSVDDCDNVKLTGINSRIAATGEAAYGCYGIGYAIDRFYGCDFDLPTYAAIMTIGGSVYFGDSTKEAVAALNEELSLGLTQDELDALEEKNSTITTGGNAIMIFSNPGGSARIDGGTILNAGKACFLTRSGVAQISVDGADGAQLNSEIGVILQMIDLDKAPRVNEEIDGITYAVYPGPYAEPYASYEEVKLSSTATPTEGSEKDVVADFANIELTGDFYNGTTDSDTVQNLQLNLDNTKVSGVISASYAVHEKAELYPEDWGMIGTVTNTVHPAVNNGVLLSMTNGSTWEVTGISYITRLEIDETSQIIGSMLVDGVETEIAAGIYTGNVVLFPEGADLIAEEPIEREISEPKGSSGGPGGGAPAGPSPEGESEGGESPAE